MSNIVGIVKYHQVSQGLKMHLDNLDPKGDFEVPRCLGIGLSVSGIGSDSIGKYMSKI